MEKIIQKFKAMGDENRFRILMLLLERPLCVCELLEVLDIKGGTLSAHLKILKNVDLISHKKEGRWIIYSISSNDNKKYLEKIEQELEDNKIIQNDKMKIGKISREICSTRNRL
ncbi:MAG: winged helix-turn-helix transcriptional regulator [Spirochaetales bacterium]|nr:winged helix-turn-helix transcriptional regulator [Spirochaetales bacterium]